MQSQHPANMSQAAAERGSKDRVADTGAKGPRCWSWPRPCTCSATGAPGTARLLLGCVWLLSCGPTGDCVSCTAWMLAHLMTGVPVDSHAELALPCCHCVYAYPITSCSEARCWEVRARALGPNSASVPFQPSCVRKPLALTDLVLGGSFIFLTATTAPVSLSVHRQTAPAHRGPGTPL